MQLRAVVCGWMVAAFAGGAAAGQAPGAPGKAEAKGAAQNAPYTLQVTSRVVLTDVLVTDKQGNPVTGLTQEDFRIFDNGKPQTLASFEEHREQVTKLEEASTSPGEFSNGFLRHPPPQVNVLLFDTTTIGMIDQMVLFQQMKKFVDRLPAGEPVAVFVRSGDVTLQLSTFTDDHHALMVAIGRAIPHFQRPGAWMASDMDTLQQMAVYLSQVPGRKNLIWFTGGSNLYLNTDPAENPGMTAALNAAANSAQRHRIYDVLESERIAIYPIDARGLTVTGGSTMEFQQMQMWQDAAATGGAAYVNTNGLARAAQHIVSTDGDYYSLTYAPQDLKTDGKWHRVEVKLDRRGYELSYRHGYFDDGSNPAGQEGPPGRTRTVLKAGGRKVEVPNDRSDPIVFSAEVEPERAGTAPLEGDPPLKRGQLRCRVRYSIRAKDVYPEKVAGNTGTDVMGSAVLAFNSYGEPVAKRMLQVTLTVDEARERAVPHARIEFVETVNLPKGRNYLYLALWDTMTGRMGTVNAEVDVKKQPVAGSW
jgi:VWFA-related protein